MIKLLSLVSMLALAQAAFGQAQTITLINGGTNNIAADTTNTYSLVIGKIPGSTVGVGADIKLAGAGTAGVLFTFVPSVDGVTYDTGKSFLLRANANGTATNTTVTNFTVGGYTHLKLISVANTNASILTNLTLKYTIKEGQ